MSCMDSLLINFIITMMKMPKIAIYILLLILISCTNSNDKTSNANSVFYNFGDTEFHLEKKLHIGHDDEFVLGFIEDVQVDSNGNIYVLDSSANKIKIFTPEGHLKNTIEGQGEGPGDFEEMSNIHIGEGDSLFVFDEGLQRITVFNHHDSSEYSEIINLTSVQEGNPREMWVMDDDRFLMGYQRRFNADNLDESRIFTLNTVNRNGEIGEKILSVKGEQSLTKETGSGFRVMTKPFARSPVFALHENYLIYGRNDSLRVQFYSLEGDVMRTMAFDYQPIEITRSERREMYSRWRANFTSEMEDQIPNTWPVFETFAIDNSNRIWFDVKTADNRSGTDFLVADIEGNKIGSASMSEHIMLQQVKDNFLYGIYIGDSDVLSVVVYEITAN